MQNDPKFNAIAKKYKNMTEASAADLIELKWNLLKTMPNQMKYKIYILTWSKILFFNWSLSQIILNRLIICKLSLRSLLISILDPSGLKVIKSHKGLRFISVIHVIHWIKEVILDIHAANQRCSILLIYFQVGQLKLLLPLIQELKLCDFDLFSKVLLKEASWVIVDLS